MSFPIFDGNIYISIRTPYLKEKEDDSPTSDEVNGNIIPSASVLRQLAIGVETTKVIKSMKDLIIVSRDSSPVKERSGLSLSAVKSFVVGDRDDKFALEFGRDEKVMSFIQSLQNPVHFTYCNPCKMFAEGNLSRRKTGPLFETYTSITNFAKELHGAPPENFVTELAEAVGSLRTLKKMALFWSRVVEELRRLWSEGQYIPGIPEDKVPDINSCLLYQQLQVINCCISRKRRRAIVTESLEAVLKQAKNNADKSLPGGYMENPLVYAKDSSGEHVLRLGADKQLENTTLLDTGEPVYTPVLQEGPLLTEDVIKETEEFVLRTGSVGAGCSQLLSDMQAFKAANPGCILEDFIRWHSPPDWTESLTDDDTKESDDENLSPSRGHLSIRMRKAGNLWRELWETAKPIPAVRQSPLYYEDLSVEGILHGFENISPSGFFEQLFLSLLSSGCAIAEARISSNEYLYNLFKESKDYIIITCQGKNWVEKAQEICQVYETVTVMALNPDMVIRLTKPKHDQNPASVLETQSEDPKSQKDSPTTVLSPTVFSKKPPKPTSPNEKQVGYFDNERIADAVLPFKIV
ncbi:rab3 GTPase-activating protein catalytic subunit [Artemisia annua]|uniref:Rab3 GTPase-activating protein catalytic subunit n=1 Tax=Artemisia annua TaxID=35608 RepID=A0A2U1P2H4_ARTAN|nr:rab3 GTPase-activating protein catalytic subunit [Artemisia annua]